MRRVAWILAASALFMLTSCDQVKQLTSPATAPNAPSYVQVQLQSDGIQLTWQDNSDDEDGFKLQVSVDGQPWASAGSVGRNQGTTIYTAVQEQKSYSFRVAAYNGEGNSDFATSPSIQFPLNAPTQLAATQSGGIVSLSWTDNSSVEDAYILERQLSGQSWNTVRTLGPNISSTNDTLLTSTSTSVSYRVAARGGSTLSDYSNEVQVTVSGGSSVPLPPTQLNATQNAGGPIHLVWNDQSDNEDSFRIERRSQAETSFTTLHSVGANTTTYDDSSFVAGTTYIYRVFAVNRSGSSSASPEATITAQGGTGGQVPATPTGLTSAQVGLSVHLTWQDNSNNEESFQIERSSGSADPFTQMASTNPNETTFNDDNVSVGVTYIYRVTAVNSAGQSGYSNESTVTVADTLAGSVPAAPSRLNATVDQGAVHLAWQDNSSDEDGFNLYFRPDGVSTPTQFMTVNANQVTYDVSGLAAGIYYFTVTAYNTNGESGFSNEVQVQVIVGLAAPTLNGYYDSTTLSVNLNWYPDTTTPYFDYYELQRSDDGGANWYQVYQPSYTEASWNDVSVAEGMTYKYRLRIVSGASASDWSSELMIKIPVHLPAPALGGYYDTTTRSVSLNWSPDMSTPSFDYYELQRSDDGGASWYLVYQPSYTETTWNDVNVTAGLTYQYRLRVVSGSDKSDWSPTASVTVPTPLPVPYLDGFYDSTNQFVSLSWGVDMSASNWNNFEIQRSDDGGATWYQVYLPGYSETSWNDAMITPGMSYMYRIRTVSSVDVSDWSNTVIVQTSAALAVPNLNAIWDTVNQYVTISWSIDTSAPAYDYYELQRSDDGGMSWYQVYQSGPNETFWYDASVAAGMSYQYRIRGVSGADVSDWSSVAYVSVPSAPTIPNAPSNFYVSADQTANTFTFYWADNSNNESGFRVYASTDNGASFFVALEVGADQTTTTYQSFSGAAILFYVVAYNEAGESTPSGQMWGYL